MAKLILLVLALMSLGMEVEANCLPEIEQSLSQEWKGKGYSYHGIEAQRKDDLRELIRESDQLSLTQKLEISRYADSPAMELFLAAISNGQENFIEILVAHRHSCQTLREFRLYAE